MIGALLAWALALGMLGLGLATFPFPRQMSRVYGAPIEAGDAETFVRATGLRDLVLAGILGATLAAGDVLGAAATCAGTGLCAVVDLGLVLSRRAPLDVLPQAAVHLSGVAVGLAAAALLLSGT